MGKSLEYIKKRIEEGSCNNMSIEEFQNMYELSYKSYFLEGRGDYHIVGIKKDSEEIFADVTYEPDAEFDYFITETCICDGTLIFVKDLMTKILQKIGQFGTVYAPAIVGITEDNINDYVFHYHVGDFVVNSYIIEPTDKDKPWMCDKFTVMLPVKFTVEKVR
jgi:hypothetical protein